MAVANKYQDKPVVFIAVNSGNTTASVASYLKKNRISWPTIVDSARMFEKAVGVGKISLDHISSYKVLNADGVMASSYGVDAGAKLAMSTAKWNVDPEGIPASLKASWQAVEFGDFVSEAKAIERALKSKNTETQTAAQKIHDYVQGKLTATLDTATTAKTAGDEWTAYKAYTEIKYRFKGHDTPTDIKAELKTLAGSEGVKTQLTASQKLASAMKTANRSGLERAAKRLKKLIETYPDTDAAEKAQGFLDSAGIK